MTDIADDLAPDVAAVPVAVSRRLDTSSLSADTKGALYQALLDGDSRPTPDVFRLQSPMEGGPLRVPVERYTTAEFHQLEVEKVWKRVWQMACREEDIPEVGDHVTYDIVGISILVVRSAPDTIRAFRNICRHRGRVLKEYDGRDDELRCAFHGFAWNLDGSFKHAPCAWDFEHVDLEDFDLPPVQVDTWGGFVFVNLDPDCAPLAEHLGDLPAQFADWPLEDRFKQVHVGKILRCNWKVAQEAFMESYHVVATHPQLLPGMGDTITQYDSFGTFAPRSRRTACRAPTSSGSRRSRTWSTSTSTGRSATPRRCPCPPAPMHARCSPTTAATGSRRRSATRAPRRCRTRR